MMCLFLNFPLVLGDVFFPLTLCLRVTFPLIYDKKRGIVTFNINWLICLTTGQERENGACLYLFK